MELSFRGRRGMACKCALAATLVALADGFFYRHAFGSTVGVFAGSLVVAAVVVGGVSMKRAISLGAALCAAFLVLCLVEFPNPLSWSLYWLALAVAVLAPLADDSISVWRWLIRIAVFSVAGPVTLLRDAFQIFWQTRIGPASIARRLGVLVLPIAGGGLFLFLFAAANPIIGRALDQFHLPPLDPVRIIFWGLCLCVVWAVLRPASLAFAAGRQPTGEARPVFAVSPASIGLSLIVFNALFALQNGLDIAFLWSGAALPKGVTLAQYAHQGAYTLIITALLAGVFVLVALAPGSAAAQRPRLRALVVLWVAQNVLLVASSALRLWDYVDAYSLTRLRLAALIWMVLVAIGLLLICWRMLRGKSANWLVGANALAAAIALTGCGVIDLGSVAAEWNVTHAREAGGAGVALDLCYLENLGDSALVPLSELSTRRHSAPFDDRVAAASDRLMADLATRQSDWRGWTWRGDRHLGRAKFLHSRQIGRPALPLAKPDCGCGAVCE